MRNPRFDAVYGVLFAALVVISLPACTSLRDDSPVGEEGPELIDLDPMEKRVFMGNVSLVNERSRFVLIKTPTNQRLRAGMPLESFRDGERTGELLFSPEQGQGFMTADITRGNPKVGDGVYRAYSEGFGNEMSDRMKFEMEEHERLKNMSFFERKKYERAKKKRAKKKRGGR